MSFLDHLRKGLHLPSRKEEEIIDEFTQHLEEDVRFLQLHGKTEDVALREAEKNIGDVHIIARELNKTHTPRSLLFLSAKHACIFFLIYSIISTNTSLLFFLMESVQPQNFFSFGGFILFAPLAIIVLFITFLSSIKTLFSQGGRCSAPAVQLLVYTLIANVLILPLCLFIDGHVKDLFIGRFFVTYSVHIYYELTNVLFLTVATSALIFIIFSLAFLLVATKKTEEGFIVRI